MFAGGSAGPHDLHFPSHDKMHLPQIRDIRGGGETRRVMYSTSKYRWVILTCFWHFHLDCHLMKGMIKVEMPQISQSGVSIKIYLSPTTVLRNLNITFILVNEKIYIFLWFWLLLLAFLSTLVVAYRMGKWHSSNWYSINWAFCIRYFALTDLLYKYQVIHRSVLSNKV